MRRALIIVVTTLAVFLFAPAAQAVTFPNPPPLGPGQCHVQASVPVHESYVFNGQVVTGGVRNQCVLPSSPFTTQMVVQKRQCTLFGWDCYYRTFWHSPISFAHGQQIHSFASFAPWKGSGWYRIGVLGTCLNCQSRQGADYGTPRKLR